MQQRTPAHHPSSTTTEFTSIFPGRYTATIEGEFVVLLIGMPINRPARLHRWLPVFRKMAKMIEALEDDPDSGFLGSQRGLFAVVQYWRSFEDLERYARDPGAWRRRRRRSWPSRSSRRSPPGPQGRARRRGRLHGPLRRDDHAGAHHPRGRRHVHHRRETGTLTCAGNFRGHRITGPGTMGFVEQYSGGSCRGHRGTGTGTLTYTVPTTAGLEHVTAILSVTRTASVVRAEVRSPEAHFSGVGLALFRQGNCFLRPCGRSR